MDSVLHPLYSSHHASSEYQLLDPLGEEILLHHYTTDKPLQDTICQWQQRREKNLYWMGIHTPGQGWKNAVDKMETT
jgi:hypothetical protein